MSAAELHRTLSVSVIAERVRFANERDTLIRKMGRHLRDAHRACREGRLRDSARSLEKLDQAQRQFLDMMEITMAALAVPEATSERLANELRARFRAGEDDVREVVLKLAAEVCETKRAPKAKEKSHGRS